MLPQPHLQLIVDQHNNLIIVIQVVFNTIRFFLQCQWNILDESIWSLKCMRDFRVIIGNRPNRWLRDRNTCLCQERCLLRRLQNGKSRNTKNQQNGILDPIIHSLTKGFFHLKLQFSSLQSFVDPKVMIRTRTYTIIKVVQIRRNSISILVDKGAIDC